MLCSLLIHSLPDSPPPCGLTKENGLSPPSARQWFPFLFCFFFFLTSFGFFHFFLTSFRNVLRWGKYESYRWQLLGNPKQEKNAWLERKRAVGGGDKVFSFSFIWLRFLCVFIMPCGYTTHSFRVTLVTSSLLPQQMYSSLSCVVLLVYIDIPDPSTNTKSRFSLMSKYRVCLLCCSSTNLLEDIRSGVKLVTGGHWWTCCQMVFAADAEAHRADSTEWQGGEAAG